MNSEGTDPMITSESNTVSSFIDTEPENRSERGSKGRCMRDALILSLVILVFCSITGAVVFIMVPGSSSSSSSDPEL